MENYYKILNVAENATQDEIKKSFRKLAKENHPDKGGDENTFKKINEAYETLSDENKRNQYDNRNNNPFGNQGFNPFSDFFGGFNQQRGGVSDKIINVNITVTDSLLGKEKEFTYDRKFKCEPCNGMGGNRNRCGSCNGSGYIQQQVGMGMFTQVFTSPCNVCGTKGYTLTNVCSSCHGNGHNVKKHTIKIQLPVGIDDSQFIKLQGNGDYSNAGYGNLVIRVQVIPENNFEKMGDDLIYNAYFNYDELMNDTLEIPHPTGTISINLPEEFNTTKPLRIKTKGFNGGDLYVKLFVKFLRKDLQHI